ncbi:hypothetical protein Anapl_17683 [Anas platyrhynchos]|uniref:Uncharacterized protein n=1 Tax=Anas platyrhynchos TaxID=8839 RepID=R0KCP1_ANAPL|nr:hypothetical protein Anapl_17683 [Anas platyrhynchos]
MTSPTKESHMQKKVHDCISYKCCTTSDTAYRDLPPAASQTPRESMLRDVSNAFLTTSSSREGTRAALTEQSSSVQDSSPHRPYSHQYSASKISCADGGGEGTNLMLRCAAPKRGGSAQFLRLNLLSEGVRQAPEQTAGNRGQPQAGSKPAPFRSLDAISPRVLPHRISQAAWAFGLAVLPQNRDLCPCLGIPNWQWHQTSQTRESDQEVSAIQTIQLFQPSTH